MNLFLKRLVTITGLLWAFGLAMLFLYHFLIAYQHGGRVILDITMFGEAKLELVVLLVIVVPVMTATIFHYLRSP